VTAGLAAAGGGSCSCAEARYLAQANWLASRDGGEPPPGGKPGSEDGRLPGLEVDEEEG